MEKSHNVSQSELNVHYFSRTFPINGRVQGYRYLIVIVINLGPERQRFRL